MKRVLWFLGVVGVFSLIIISFLPIRERVSYGESSDREVCERLLYGPPEGLRFDEVGDYFMEEAEGTSPEFSEVLRSLGEEFNSAEESLDYSVVEQLSEEVEEHCLLIFSEGAENE